MDGLIILFIFMGVIIIIGMRITLPHHKHPPVSHK